GGSTAKNSRCTRYATATSTNRAICAGVRGERRRRKRTGTSGILGGARNRKREVRGSEWMIDRIGPRAELGEARSVLAEVQPSQRFAPQRILHEFAMAVRA